MSDSEMVEGILRGTVDFAVLVARYQDAARRWFCHWTGNTTHVEELTQCLFIRVWEALPRFSRSRASLARWLFIMAHNLFLNWRKHRSYEPEQSLDAMDEDSGPTVSGPGLYAAVLRAAEKLDPDHEYVIKACGVDGLTHEEAAKERGVSVRTIERWWSEACARIRRMV